MPHESSSGFLFARSYGTTRYWYLCESIRTPKGPRRRVLCYWGKDARGDGPAVEEVRAFMAFRDRLAALVARGQQDQAKAEWNEDRRHLNRQLAGCRTRQERALHAERMARSWRIQPDRLAHEMSQPAADRTHAG